MSSEQLKKSIEARLGELPVHLLQDVDFFIKNLILENSKDVKSENKDRVMDYAGSWSDMDSKVFEEYIDFVKEMRNDDNVREVDI